MVIIEDIYLSADELLKLTDKKFTVVKAGQMQEMPQQGGEVVKKLVLPVKLSNEKIRNWIPNRTSLKVLVSKFSDDTDKWIGKAAEFEIAKQNVRGEMKDIIFVKK